MNLPRIFDPQFNGWPLTAMNVLDANRNSEQRPFLVRHAFSQRAIRFIGLPQSICWIVVEESVDAVIHRGNAIETSLC